MKKIIQVLCLFALSMILTGMAEAGVLTKSGQQLKKVRTTSLNFASKVEKFETYFGEKFSIKEVAGYKAGTSAVKVLKSPVIKLKNGKTYNVHEVEYAYVAEAGNKAPHQRAPHQRAPNKKAPHI